MKTAVGVTRKGYDRMKTRGRDEAPFVLTVEGHDGLKRQFLARAVIDASGTYETPNPLGAGVPALGERQHAQRIFYGIPDVLRAHRAHYAGKRVLVVGSGHSAFNALLDLAALVQEEPLTEAVWAVRRQQLGNLFGGGQSDALPARGSLGSRLQSLLDNRIITLVPSFQAEALELTGNTLCVKSETHVLEGIDEIVVATGFRPDLAPLRELRLHLDPVTESPVALAPLIDPNVHSCGTVRPHGALELQHPEKDFFIVGMKSYGRAPTFLLLTGYEQVRSVVAQLAGDMEDARAVKLELPETGVCSTGVQAACCSGSVAPEAQLPELEVVQAGKPMNGCCG